MKLLRFDQALAEVRSDLQIAMKTRLTKDLCRAIHDCVDIVRDNAVYKWMLEDRTTFYNYWIDLQDNIG